MRVLVTRPTAQADPLVTALADRGFDVVVVPLIRVEPLSDEPIDVSGYEWVVVTSPNGARELQIFCPLSFQPPSALVAVERSDARSLPDSGSDQACAQISSPLAIFGSTRSSCSSVPCANSVGASIEVPLALARPGAPARKYSSS